MSKTTGGFSSAEAFPLSCGGDGGNNSVQNPGTWSGVLSANTSGTVNFVGKMKGPDSFEIRRDSQVNRIPKGQATDVVIISGSSEESVGKKPII